MKGIGGRGKVLERDSVVKALREALEGRDRVVSAYLFGSVARESLSTHDVDVALVLDGRDRGGRACFLGCLVSDLAKALGVNEDMVNVADLREADLYLKYKVLTEGVRVVGDGRVEEELRRELNERYPEARQLLEMNLREWLASPDPPTLDPSILKRRMDFIRAEGDFLDREVLSKPQGEVVGSEVLKRLLERSVHMITEALLNICRHVVSAKGWGPAETYLDYLRLMAEHGAIPQNLADSLKRYVAWRNVITHRYLEIDHRELYEDSKELKRLTRWFERQVTKLLREA